VDKILKGAKPAGLPILNSPRSKFQNKSGAWNFAEIGFNHPTQLGPATPA
jgi:hypothetical protein